MHQGETRARSQSTTAVCFHGERQRSWQSWTQIHSLAKSSQMKAVCAWLSGERLPAVVESFAKAIVWCREGVRGQKAIVVLNASFDQVQDLALKILAEDTGFVHFNPIDGRRESFGAHSRSSPLYVRLTITAAEPWSIHLLVNGW